jgi:apolipoprotein N-acyltransferase
MTAPAGSSSARTRRAAASLAGRFALVVASAALVGLAFPPSRARWLAWVALTPFLLALRGTSWRAAFALGWTWSVLMAWSVGQWMPDAIETYYHQTRAVGYGFFLLVATLMVAPYHTAFALVCRVLVRHRSAWLPLWVACAWVASELGRGRLLTGTSFFIGNPWALLGYSQVGSDALVQIASVAGVYGISFAIAAVNAGVVEVLAALRPGAARGSRLAAARAAAAAALPALAALAYGHASLASAPPAGAIPPDATRIALIQGNVSVGSRWRSDDYGRNLELYLRMTLEALQRSRPPLVFWPESAMTFFFESEPLYRAAIARVTAPFDAELVAGAPRAVEDGAGARYWNSVYLVAPRGEIRARYDKRYLVPFGEYFPLGTVAFLRRRFGPAREFTPGEEAPLLPTRAGAAGVVTCNEAMLPEVVRERIAAGAEILVNPSNDTWVPGEKFAALQFDIVTLRAVEARRTLVRVSTSGPSAIVDPWGRVLARTDAFSRAVLEHAIAPRRDVSLYARLGDAFAFGCLLVTAAALAMRARRSGRAQPAPGPAAR